MQSQAIAAHGDAIAAHFAGLQFQRLTGELVDTVLAAAAASQAQA